MSRARDAGCFVLLRVQHMIATDVGRCIFEDFYAFDVFRKLRAGGI